MTTATMKDRERACLGELARWAPDLTPALEGTGATLEDVQAALVSILPLMPDPGWRDPAMRAFSTGGAIYVAVHLALKPKGLDAAGSWAVCEAATRTHFARMKGLERTAASAGMFSWLMKWMTRSLEARSQAAPVGGWALHFVPGDGTIDYGVDYTKCAIRQLAIDAGAADFAPFICNSDAIGSAELGWGLVRTETLAQGGQRCDFRFVKGGETKVRLHVAPSSRRD